MHTLVPPGFLMTDIGPVQALGSREGRGPRLEPARPCRRGVARQHLGHTQPRHVVWYAADGTLKPIGSKVGHRRPGRLDELDLRAQLPATASTRLMSWPLKSSASFIAKGR